MSENSYWSKQLPLEDAMEAIIDYRGKTPPKTLDGVPLITAKVIKNGKILKEPQEFIAEEFYDEWMTRGLPKINDVLLTTEAPLGEVAAIRTTSKIALAQRVILLRSDPGLLDQTFLLYLMQSPLIQSRLSAVASGTTVLGIKQSELRKVLLTLPPIENQLVIGSALRSFDDLIDNNTRRIEILEESAKALYREWFVHYRYPGHENDTMVDSQLGPIPKGWEITTLEKRCSLKRDSLNPQKNLDETFAHFSIPAFDEGRKPEIVLGANIKSSKHLLQDDCVLLSKLNPRFPRVWWTVPFLKTHRAICSTEFLPLIANKDWPLPFIYSMVSNNQFVKMLAGRANGTSGSHQRIKPDDLMNLSVISPPMGVIQAFVQETYKNLEAIGNLIMLNDSLASIRDLLLPRLISGELDVSDLDLVA